MSKIPELQTSCPAHKVKISTACFYKGCSQALLCRYCFRDHPREHESETKDIIDMMDDNSWIEEPERQKGSELGQIEGIYQQKKEILTENEHLLNEFIQSIIANLEAQKQIWLKELNDLTGFSDQEERELDGGLGLLRNFDFAGDIFEKIQKVKNFNDDVLPNIKQLIGSCEITLKKWKIDKEKIEGYKAELAGIVQSIGIKNLLADESFISLKISEEQLNNAKAQLESLDLKNHDLVKDNSTLKSQLDEALEDKANLENDYKKEVGVLKSQIAEMETEGSKIIQVADLAKLKGWIPKPPPLRVTRLKLIYRASRDGWNAKTFHAKCDGFTPTISIIKSQEYGKIFGGYTTQNWGSSVGLYVEDKDAFIFSLTHGEKYPCKDPSKAIYAGSRGSDFLVVFGDDGSETSDIFIAGDCNTTMSYCGFPNSYVCPRFSSSNSESQAYLAGAEAFKAEELEVYQVVFF